MKTLREEIVSRFKKEALACAYMIQNPHLEYAKMHGKWMRLRKDVPKEDLLHMVYVNSSIYASASNAKTIVFSAEQAQVFTERDTIYSGSLDFRLPFKETLIQFTKPVTIPYSFRDEFDFQRGDLMAAVLTQWEGSVAELKQHEQKMNLGYLGIPSLSTMEFLKQLYDKHGLDQNIVINVIHFIYSDWSGEHVNWVSGETTIGRDDVTDEQQKAMTIWKNMIISCIGFINCENVYLHREEGAPEAVNRKREKKGKARIEPYYTCRIRGVNYDSYPTGTGTQHGYIYDVRGHFRRYSSTGKVTWVRPHQRGLQSGGPYIPKTYVVDKQNSGG